MVRALKYHEKKLLRKVDFTTYKSDANHHAASICRRYVIQKPDDFTKYNRICGSLRQLAHALSSLLPTDPVRIKTEKVMMEKLYDMGILSQTTKLSEVERKVGVSKLARRRLGVVMTRLGMADNVTAALKFVEQGHVRVGTEVVTDGAFLVTRNMEDFVTWVDSSKVKRNILKYREKLDDFDLL
ncbi:Small subunit (SSU) processome component [Mycoblastus sanguinarius]|nr:Small subunit (SSU) processome component [Mycoblastus sanguinarius]